VSYHGIAINIDPDLKFFRAISPCGMEGSVVTSLEELFQERDEMVPTMQALKRALIEEFASEFLLEVDEPVASPATPARMPRPDWLKVKAPGSARFLQTNDVVRKLRLVTVCEEAMCPNIGECWSHHTATFMIMGDLCTRRCSFCNVKDGSLESLQPLDPLEPYRVGRAVAELGLKHVVITSVNRDDLSDMGADHFDKTVRAIRKQNPDCRIELLIPDMRGRRELVRTILQSGLIAVLNHNIETVPRLYRTVRPGANLGRSLSILGWAKELFPEVKTKSGVMVGLGETADEVLGVMDALRVVGVEILTVGQYLQPSKKQLPVERFVTPEEFAFYKEEAMKKGFTYVESGPLVRSSYHAWQHSIPEGQPGVPFELPPEGAAPAAKGL
jgi:lipoic acid synthetase